MKNNSFKRTQTPLFNERTKMTTGGSTRRLTTAACRHLTHTDLTGQSTGAVPIQLHAFPRLKIHYIHSTITFMWKEGEKGEGERERGMQPCLTMLSQSAMSGVTH